MLLGKSLAAATSRLRSTSSIRARLALRAISNAVVPRIRRIGADSSNTVSMIVLEARSRSPGCLAAACPTRLFFSLFLPNAKVQGNLAHYAY